MVGRQAERLADRPAASHNRLSPSIFGPQNKPRVLSQAEQPARRAGQVTEMMLTAALPANPPASLRIPGARGAGGGSGGGWGEDRGPRLIGA